MILLSQRLLHKTLLLVRDFTLTFQCSILQLNSSFCDVCMCVSVEVVEETPEIEGTFTSSDVVVKSKHQTQATSPSGENLIAHIYSYINCICMWLS